MSATTTRHTLEYLRRNGYEADVVERWVPSHGGSGPGHRKDLFGCIDVVAVGLGCPTLAVQCTTAGHARERVRKIRASSGARLWVLSGCALEVHGWAKKSGRWEVSIVVLRISDFPEPGREERRK